MLLKCKKILILLNFENLLSAYNIIFFIFKVMLYIIIYDSYIYQLNIY